MWITNKLKNRQFVMCLFAKEIVGLPLGELEGNSENSSSWAGKRDCGCLLLIIIFVENGGKAKYCRVLALSPGSTAGSNPGSIYRHPRGL